MTTERADWIKIDIHKAESFPRFGDPVLVFYEQALSVDSIIEFYVASLDNDYSLA